MSIIKSIIDLAHILGLEVLVEVVETPQDTKYLKGVSCDIGKGYYFYKPMPAKELENILQNNRK